MRSNIRRINIKKVWKYNYIRLRVRDILFHSFGVLCLFFWRSIIITSLRGLSLNYTYSNSFQQTLTPWMVTWFLKLMTMHSGTTPFAYIFFTIRPSLWTILYSFLTCYQMAVPLGLHFIHFSLATIRLSLWNYILFISHLLLPNGRPFGTIFYSISHATIRPSLWD